MTMRVLVLGAGFGGLELTTTLCERLGEEVEVTLLDRNDAFVFGFSKLDAMFGLASDEEVRHPYRDLGRPGLRFRRETITSLDPARRRVTTDRGVHEGEILVIALGADYEAAATPGLVAGKNEFYTLEGATALREALAKFRGGDTVVGVCASPFKCPPAPSEAALLLHDHLTARRLREGSTITLVLPFETPIPVSPATSEALLTTFRERGIRFVAGRSVARVDAPRRAVELDDGRSLPCDLFLGVPKHVAPRVVVESGLTEDGWVPVDPGTLATRFPGVFAIGDVTGLEVPMAGLFAESAARTVAQAILAGATGGARPPKYSGAGACYVEFGGGRVGRTDVDFLSGPEPTASFVGPTRALAAEKRAGAVARRARWFGTGAASP